MYTYDSTQIDNKFTELLQSVEDKNLRSAMKGRLRRNSHLVVGAIIMDESGKICLVQETKGPWAGKWNVPLGHLEYGETMPAAAKREVKEETGYDIELTALLPPQNASLDNSFRILYLGKIIGGSPDERQKDDISSVKWFTISEIQQLAASRELRDEYVLNDVLLAKDDCILPLDTIREVRPSSR